MRLRHGRLIGECLLALALSGCTAQQQYTEKYNLQSLNVVFLDEQSVGEQYLLLSGRPAVEILADHGSISTKTVRGFFDSRTNTVYCQKMDFEVCGHELHHAVIGHFHGDR